MNTIELNSDELRQRLHTLGLHGLLAQWDEIRDGPWLYELVDIEEAERRCRSLARRLRDSRIGVFKPLADYDWSWPDRIDRHAIEELFQLRFLTRESIPFSWPQTALESPCSFAILTIMLSSTATPYASPAPATARQACRSGVLGRSCAPDRLKEAKERAVTRAAKRRKPAVRS